MGQRLDRLAGVIGTLLTLGCSPGGPGEATPDAGPPPRPYFLEVEGLRWGMTPEEVLAIWGPDTEGEALFYEKKAGFVQVGLGYTSLRRDDVPPDDAKPTATETRPMKFLAWISFHGDASKPRDRVRADLVARFGEPLADPKLLRVNHCEKATSCELWRAAECTLVKAEWRPAAPDLWPEHLGLLTYGLAPDSLIQYVPRSEWTKLRGTVPLSYPSQTDATIMGMRRGVGGANVAEISKSLGPPNLHLEKGPGSGTLFYLFLDGSLQCLRVEGGTLQGVIGSTWP